MKGFFPSHLLSYYKSEVRGSFTIQERAERKWKKQWLYFQAWLPSVKQLFLCWSHCHQIPQSPFCLGSVVTSILNFSADCIQNYCVCPEKAEFPSRLVVSTSYAFHSFSISCTVMPFIRHSEEHMKKKKMFLNKSSLRIISGFYHSLWNSDFTGAGGLY